MGMLAKAVSGWFILTIIGLLYIEYSIFNTLINAIALGAVVGWAILFLIMTFVIGCGIIGCGIIIVALWSD